METLEAWDRAIVLAINGWHSPWADSFFWTISGKLTWIPVYLYFFWRIAKLYGVKSLYIFIPLALASVGLADFISSQVIKEGIARYRPSHHALLTDLLRFHPLEPGHVYKGGQYGFVSSHATNFAAIATWIVLLFKGKNNILVSFAVVMVVLVGYSRMYLGVHYLSDVIGGTILGAGFVLLIFKLSRKYGLLKFLDEPLS